MAEVIEPIEQDPLVVHTSPVMEMDDAQFFQFCQINRDLRIERTAEGDLTFEYMQNGARLGWLLDSAHKWVHVYRPGQAPEVLDHPLMLSGEPVLNGFILDVPQVWAAMERKK